MRRILLLPMLMIFLFSSCFLSQPDGEGSLRLSFAEVHRSIRWQPDFSFEIDEYRITLTRGGQIISAVHGNGGDDLLIDGIPAGIWEITVEGFNDTGEKIAMMEDGSITADIKRGEVFSASARMVPWGEGSGTLKLTLGWDLADEELIEMNPLIRLGISCINDRIDGYEPHQDDDTEVDLSFGEHGETVILDSGNLEIVLTGEGTEQVITLEGLPPGWYQVMTALEVSSYEGRYWKGVGFARIADGAVTAAEVQLFDERLESGAPGISISDEIPKPFDLAVDTAPGQVMKPGMEVVFSSSYTSAAASYRWHLNGELLEGEDGDELVHVFTDTGPWRIALSVREQGLWVGASRDVMISGYEIGDAGPAGGMIFFDKGSYDHRMVSWHEESGDFITSRGTSDLPWRYLEAAPAGWHNIPGTFHIITQGGFEGAVDLPAAWGSTSVPGMVNEFFVTTDAESLKLHSCLGAGVGNTERIIAHSEGEGYAAFLASQCGEGGFEDWFLPSIDELSLMQERLHAVGDFDDNYYWSSTEFDGQHAWAKSFLGGFHVTASEDVQLYRFVFSKNTLRLVRPVRAF